jgi:predicted RNase H-like HicB family nuclease/DNA-binding XRE family transcriptional regulator
MTYHFILHQEENGYWAECCELEGCVTQTDMGDSCESLGALSLLCEEALNLYLEEPPDSKVIFPLPNKALHGKKNIIEAAVEPEIALAVLLRYYRANAHMTQKQAAEKLGMKNVYSYQRLEKKSNPTLAIMKKIHAVFPEIPFDYLF